MMPIPGFLPSLSKRIDSSRLVHDWLVALTCFSELRVYNLIICMCCIFIRYRKVALIANLVTPGYQERLAGSVDIALFYIQ